MTDPQNATQNETVTFNTNLTLAEIENRLSGLENFDVKEKSEDELVVNVGNALKYRFLGVYLTQDFQAPITIDASDNGDGTVTVELHRRGQAGTVISTSKNDQFFATSFQELQTALSG